MAYEVDNDMFEVEASVIIDGMSLNEDRTVQVPFQSMSPDRVDLVVCLLWALLVLLDQVASDPVVFLL